MSFLDTVKGLVRKGRKIAEHEYVLKTGSERSFVAVVAQYERNGARYFSCRVWTDQVGGDVYKLPSEEWGTIEEAETRLAVVLQQLEKAFA